MKKLIIITIITIVLSSCYNGVKNNLDIEKNIEEIGSIDSKEIIDENVEMEGYVNSIMTEKDFYKTVDCDKYVNTKVIEQCKKDKEKLTSLIKSNSGEIESINNKVNTDFYNENTQKFIKELQEKPEILLNDCSELGDSETISYCLNLQKDYNDSLNKNN